jgi:hypothetical protein
MRCLICAHESAHGDVENGVAAGGFVCHLCAGVLHRAHPRTFHTQQCLPGFHEPYGATPPGEAALCRHCGALLPREETR